MHKCTYALFALSWESSRIASLSFFLPSFWFFLVWYLCARVHAFFCPLDVTCACGDACACLCACHLLTLVTCVNFSSASQFPLPVLSLHISSRVVSVFNLLSGCCAASKLVSLLSHTCPKHIYSLHASFLSPSFIFLATSLPIRSIKCPLSTRKPHISTMSLYQTVPLPH